MRTVEVFKLAGHLVGEPLRGGRRGPSVAAVHGSVIVRMDEELVRELIRRACRGKARTAKLGPIHVRLAGAVAPARGIDPEDDVFDGHAWATRANE